MMPRGAPARFQQGRPRPRHQDCPLNIENARQADADALLALRNHYIAHSFATFDEEIGRAHV